MSATKTPISVLSHLESIFRNIQLAVTAGDTGSTEEPARNAKGDIVKWFDLAANEAASAYLKEHVPCPVVLLSEAGSPRELGTGQPACPGGVDAVVGADAGVRKGPAGAARTATRAGGGVWCACS